MSRIGRLPVELPANVTAEVNPGNEVVVKGPKGELRQKFSNKVEIKLDGNVIHVTRASDDKQIRALHGLTRAMIANMAHGVEMGYSKELEIVGVGFRAQLSGKKLVMNLGFTHTVEVEPKEGISFEVPSQTQIIVKGIDKQMVGQVAADIRAIKPPEPYKGKGIRYAGEYVALKEGKSGM